MGDKAISKNFKGTLIVNWKTGAMRVIKRTHSKLSPYEIPIQIDLDIEVPKSPKIVAKGKIVIPQYKANQIIMEAL